jgi:hypothetical protein
MTMSKLHDLHRVEKLLAPRFAEAEVRSPENAPFLFVQHAGRAVEIYDAPEGWVLECWEENPDDSAPPVKELRFGCIDDAARAAAAWLGREDE